MNFGLTYATSGHQDHTENNQTNRNHRVVVNEVRSDLFLQQVDAYDS